MRTADFDFELPADLIAQVPSARRDESRLLVLDRATGSVAHRRFVDLLEYLRPGDALVVNNSRVIPARLRASNARSGGLFEILLLEQNSVNDWWVLLRPGKRGRMHTRLRLHGADGEPADWLATVVEINEEGHRRLHFEGSANIADVIGELGEVPLPPYIRRAGRERDAVDRERYQTVYAEPSGSVAAPTAGLHFTPELLASARAKSVNICEVTLHVGLGTFAPVKASRMEEHRMHSERYEISAATAAAVQSARASGGRVIAVGTTTVRVLESAMVEGKGRLEPRGGRTSIFIYPPREFAMTDALVTNFHLPCSTLLMLVSAFAAPGRLEGRDVVMRAYAEAIRERYRFFSYGDAMLLI
jgi:S-adenosylmethionine:tRNA ribosyltransferase-isomerase